MQDLEAEILKGIQSGDPVEMTADDWKAMREEVIRRHAARGGADSQGRAGTPPTAADE